MATALPHTGLVQGQMASYLGDIESTISAECARVGSSPEFRGVFKTSLGGYAVLRSMGRRQLGLVRAASEITKRLPMLVVCRQVTAAYVELRRLVEVLVWFPYFREHPVEWEELCASADLGFVRDQDKPIRYCAHREFGWYVAYLRERYPADRNDIVAGAVDELSRAYSNACAYVHGAVTGTGGVKVLEDTGADVLSEYRLAQRSVLSAGCIVVAKGRPRGLAKLNGVERAWFNWLVGATRAKRIAAEGV